MKKISFLTLLILFTTVLLAQSPQNFKYQTVIRDGAGQVIQNQNVSLRISILSGSMSGPLVYQEEHSVTTNDFGLVNIEIGGGNVVSGDFTTINWGNNSYFVQVELDETGGTTYQIMGVSQLLSVPYAMYADKAGMADSTIWKKNNNNIFYNDGNVGIGEITPTGKLVVKSDTSAAIDDVIFSVLNLDGDTVLAVYQEGVRIWVADDTSSGTKASGSRGGFAVGGFSPAKGMTNEYLRVTPDSVRVYIEEGTGGTKASGSRGGFAVGGFSPAKAFTNEFLRVTDDSSRVWTDGNGGFEILDLATGSTNYLDLTPDNYFIGHESGDMVSSGLYNSTLGYQSGFGLFNGNDNSFIGYQSGYSTTNGTGNLFLGYQSGYQNTVGSYNTFVGFKSGFSNQTGINNSFLGTASGYSNTDGNYNTFVGDSTGYSNVSGTGNAFFGDRAGFNNTTGSNNVFLGNLTGFSNAGDSCIFIGNQSGYQNFGLCNVFIGNRAGYSNTSGYYNVFNGYMSGYSNTSGQNNIFMGTNAGFSNSSGNYNVFVGTRAGYKNTSGWYNMFFGYQSGYENTTANNNLFMGYFTGHDNTSGNFNIFIGNHTGQQNTTGNSNIFIGGSAGYNNSGGSSNVFIGSMAGNDNTTGNWNTFLGFNTGMNNTTGYMNCLMGYKAGDNNTIGANNTLIGCNAGEWLQTGNFNTAVGYQAGNRIYGGSYSVFLGYRAGYYEDESNRLFIENSWADSTGALIYGRFDDDWVRINNSMGIGRNPDVNSFEVEGDASKTTAGSWLANSDKRIKTDIRNIENSYELVLKLRPVTFRYTDEWIVRHPGIEDKVYYNFIAQEYQQVFPQSVKGSGEYIEGDQEEILQIDTYNAQIITTQAVKDLIKENQAQQAEIEKLKTMIKELQDTFSVKAQN